MNLLYNLSAPLSHLINGLRGRFFQPTISRNDSALGLCLRLSGLPCRYRWLYWLLKFGNTRADRSCTACALTLASIIIPRWISWDNETVSAFTNPSKRGR